MVRTAEFLVLTGHNKRLRDKIEIFQTFRMLHPLNVLIQSILTCQLIRSWEMIDTLMRPQRSQNTFQKQLLVF